MSEFAGMTVNERLFHAGVMDQFDAAIDARNKDDAISILQQTELPIEAATETVTAILNNPEMYGYSEK
ncbi:MAG: hypothetical protein P8N43_13130 [Alphaproteobacteria bacterium]|nr:hypothetical protein [Alphaproteobacteria bacterium]